MKVSVLLLLIGLSPMALAIEGKYAPADKELASSCKLVCQVWDTKSKTSATGVCSSSYIGNKSFVTAEHCHELVSQAKADFDKKLTNVQPYLQCPGSDKRYPVTQSQGHATANPNYPQGLGLLKVAVAPEVAPLLLPKAGEEVDELLAKKDECFINGYGLDNDQKYGTLRAAAVDSMEVKKGSTKATLRGNLGVHGDSGGPLYCMTERGPVLVAVIQGGTKYVKATDVEKLASSLTWLTHARDTKKSIYDSDREISLYEDITDNCSAVNECRDKLVAAHKLTKEMAAIIEKLNQETKTISEKIKSGEGESPVKLERTWQELVNIWEKEGCYKILN